MITAMTFLAISSRAFKGLRTADTGSLWVSPPKHGKVSKVPKLPKQKKPVERGGNV